MTNKKPLNFLSKKKKKGKLKINYFYFTASKLSYYWKHTCAQLWWVLPQGVHSGECPSLSNQQPGSPHSHNQNYGSEAVKSDRVFHLRHFSNAVKCKRRWMFSFTRFIDIFFLRMSFIHWRSKQIHLTTKVSSFKSISKLWEFPFWHFQCSSCNFILICCI